MVSLASQLVDAFPDAAYCPGSDNKTFIFPESLIIEEANSTKNKQMRDFNGKKIMAFVSDDCFVSMVETVVKARRFAEQKNDVKLIVASLQQLSDKHLSMSRMISGGRLFFVDDEKWREKYLSTRIKLPLFVEINAE